MCDVYCMGEEGRGQDSSVIEIGVCGRYCDGFIHHATQISLDSASTREIEYCPVLSRFLF